MASMAHAKLSDDDDGEGAWITPVPKGAAAAAAAAVAAPRATLDGAPAPAPRRLVASMTTDFAMQNVLMQMGLLLASPSGAKVVRTLKSWVLKCDACFTITQEMDRLFCPRCGNATLARLGVTLGDDGAPRYHYKQNRVVPIRGTQFALPSPTGGRDGDILLREDQLLTGVWAQRARVRETPEAMFAERQPGGVGAGGFLGGDGGGRRRTPTGGVPGVGPGSGVNGIVVGLGRRNPNERRGRRR